MRYKGIRDAIATLAVAALGSAQVVIAVQTERAGAIAPVDGFSRSGLAAIHDLMEDAVREGKIPSAIAMLARDGEIVWSATAGEMGPGYPMRDDAIMPLASVGKMYTATAAMLLLERGAIALDDLVSKSIPEFSQIRVAVSDDGGEARLVPPQTGITVRHLLTHTGGLQVTGDDFWAVWDSHSGQTTTTEFARALAALPLISQPGTAYLYGPTGASYEVLGAVIEIASGTTLERFMEENIFKPLGLKDSHFYLPAGKEDRMPAFYRRVDQKLQLERAHGVDFPRSTFFHGGGGVEASAMDIARFTEIFLTGGVAGGVRLLQQASVEQMMSDQLGDLARRGRSWGFGSAVRFEAGDAGGKTLVQYGWVGGGYARLWVDPVDRFVAYFAFPVEPPGHNGLLFQFEKLVEAAKSTPGPP